MKGNWNVRVGAIVGLAAGLAVAALLLGWRVSDAVGEESSRVQQRDAVVRAMAVSEVLSRVGADEDAVRLAIEAYSESDAGTGAIRVVRVGGARLEASTAPEDTGESAAPRRLAREEKELFDQAKRLQVAVRENRAEEGAGRNEEVEIEIADDGAVVVAAPVERDGDPVGAVRVASAPDRGAVDVDAAGAESLGPAPVLIVAGAVSLFAFLSLFVGERRLILGILGAVLLGLALLWIGSSGQGLIRDGRIAAESAVAESMVRADDAARAALAAVSPDAYVDWDRTSWDVDPFRNPLGMIAADGTVDDARVESALAARAGWFRKVVAGVALASFAVFAFLALGLAQRAGRTFWKFRDGYTYVSPAMIAMLVLVFGPFLYGVTLSFTESTIYNTDKTVPEIWNGLENYKSIVGDFGVVTTTDTGERVWDYQNFYWTLAFTVVWTVSNVAIGVSVGLLLALILHTKGLRLRPAYRVLLILPWAVPNYITALIWKGMFHQQFGVINQVIQMFGGESVSWFEGPFSSFITVLSTNGWLSFPFMMVVALGALQSIPSDLYEAARVDGASRWQQFRFITVPSLKPAMVPAIILSVIWTFNQFNIVYLVSQGEPGGSTEILITESYKIAFEQYRYGYAAAYSTVIFLILLVYGVWQNRVTRATEGL